MPTASIPWTCYTPKSNAQLFHPPSKYLGQQMLTFSRNKKHSRRQSSVPNFSNPRPNFWTNLNLSYPSPITSPVYSRVFLETIINMLESDFLNFHPMPPLLVFNFSFKNRSPNFLPHSDRAYRIECSIAPTFPCHQICYYCSRLNHVLFYRGCLVARKWTEVRK